MSRDQVSLPEGRLDDRALAELVAGLLIYLADSGGSWEFAPTYFDDGGSVALANRSDLNAFRSQNPGLSARMRSLCWEWQRRGVLDVVRWNGQSMTFTCTPQGEALLRGDVAEIRLASIEGALRSTLEARCPGIDRVVLELADEAVRCHRAGLQRASAVMLGSASEALLLTLFEALLPHRKALGLTSPPTGRYGAVEVLDWLATQFEQRAKGISAALHEAGQAATFVTEMPRRIRMADALRVTRNNGGHPGHSTVSADEARSFLAVFPTHAEAVHATTVALKHL